MKKTIYLLLAMALLLTACEGEDNVQTRQLLLDAMLPTADSTWVGDQSGTEIEGTYFNQFGDNFFLFDNYYTPLYGSWGGFGLTNTTDTQTGTYMNNSAITGKGVKGTAYLVANNSHRTPAKVSFVDGKSRVIQGLYITNATYAYRVMKTGNDFSKKFGNQDWFKLNIYGNNGKGVKTDSVEIYLADFRDGKTEILKTWKWIDISQMGPVNSLTFSLSSSDNGKWGMNTPAYFCVDGIKANVKPE